MNNQKEKFLLKAQKVHGNKYDYAKINYINCKQKICIICPEHGEFWQTPDGHLTGRGCPICRYISTANKLKYTKEKFIKMAREIHGWKYDYSKVEYINNKTKVCIICPEHGEFWQTPSDHIKNKSGCPKCAGNAKYSTEEFIEKAKKIHGDKYDYKNTVYIGNNKKILVTCKSHGDFLVTPHNHLKGSGCPICKESKLEKEIMNFLNSHNITFIYQYKKDKDFKKQTIDFFLPDYNLAIECQGIQHFKPVDFAGKGNDWALKNFEQICVLDKEKSDLCKSKKIKLIYYVSYSNINLAKNEIYKTHKVIKDPYDILKEIKKEP